MLRVVVYLLVLENVRCQLLLTTRCHNNIKRMAPLMLTNCPGNGAGVGRSSSAYNFLSFVVLKHQRQLQ